MIRRGNHPAADVVGGLGQPDPGGKKLFGDGLGVVTSFAVV